MGLTREQKIVRSFKKPENKLGKADYGSFSMPNNSGDHQRGIKRNDPVNDYDLVNKAYVDANSGSLTDEQVQDLVGAMVSTNTETLITVTYQDADGTLDFVVDNDLANYSNTNSAFITAGSSDTLTNKTIDGDDNTISDIAMSQTKLVAGTNITLSTDTLNVDDAFLKNDEADTGVGLVLTGDNSSADTQYTAQVLYNTDATPPAASGFPIGTIYIQYTA